MLFSDEIVFKGTFFVKYILIVSCRRWYSILFIRLNLNCVNQHTFYSISRFHNDLKICVLQISNFLKFELMFQNFTLQFYLLISSYFSCYCCFVRLCTSKFAKFQLSTVYYFKEFYYFNIINYLFQFPLWIDYCIYFVSNLIVKQLNPKYHNIYIYIE